MLPYPVLLQRRPRQPLAQDYQFGPRSGRRRTYTAARFNRAILADSVEDRLFFAGEATDPKFSTGVHGAHEPGLRAGAAAAV